jgi:hypothetical protein
MKKQAFQGLVTCVLSMAMLSACEKMVVSETSETGGAQDGNVVLRVSQFEQTPFEAHSRADVNNYCTRLCFHIYDDSGQRIQYVNQKQEDTGFGTASFSLDQGHYYLVVVGHSADSNPSFSANEKVSVSGKNLGDTFWCCEEIEVGEEGIDRSLVLRRIVSMVRFIPEDDIPPTMNQMVIKYKGSRGTFSGLTGYGTTNAAQTVELNLTGDESQYEFYLIPSDAEDAVSVTVNTYNIADDGRITSLTVKSIPDIPIRRNCITICRGNLFDNQSASKSVFITVTVDGDWGENVEMLF